MHDTDTSCLFILLLGIIPLCLTSLPVWKLFTSILNNVSHPKACSDGSWQGQFKSVTNWLKVTPTYWSLSINLMDIKLKTSQGNHSGTKHNSLKFKLIIKALCMPRRSSYRFYVFFYLRGLWKLVLPRWNDAENDCHEEMRTATPSQSISPYFSCATSTEIMRHCNLHSKAIMMPQ